ncbi:MAG: peptidase domain-containing ABC transporter [Pyrinomonadaceae bacterium]|nr:peptidase domain-containing ABC transporter [Pyrinomonadaceae bacterium]
MNGIKPKQFAPLRFSKINSWIGWNHLCFAFQAVLKRLRRQRRVPVVLQMNAVECGAACLAMILNYFGRQTSISECRERCGVGQHGLTAQTIAKAARNYGLRVKAVSIEPADFKYVQLPAIAHWNFNHFVVVERWSATKFEIVDPAAGRRRITAKAFDAGFTGVVLMLEPGVQFERRRGTGKRSWRHYLKYVLDKPGLLVQILLASLFLQVLGLALPIFTQVLVDQVLPFRITNAMNILAIGMILLVLTQLVISYLRAALLIYLQGRLDSQLMLGFFEHLLTLPLRFFQQRTNGDLLMRLGSNMIVRETLTGQTISTILDGTFVLVYLGILLTWAPLFGGIALAIGMFQVALLLGTTRRTHDLVQRDLAAGAESQSYLVEALAGIVTLKASGSETRAFDHWSNLFYRNLNVSLERNHFSASVGTVMTALRTFSPFVMLWVGAHGVLDGTLSLGAMLALNALAMSFLTPLASLVSNGQRLQLIGAHLERLNDVLQAEPEQDPRLVRSAPPLTGRIELKSVDFRYDPHAPLVLRDVSVSIEPGQKVAIVGRTGSGKSTLAKLLLGLYTPTGGELLFDGAALQSLNYATLRRQFGTVLQESFLFSGSIRQNIAFNDPSLSLEQVIEAARLAHIHDEVTGMPMGYETLLAEGGSSLSGGQRQRLALARALAHKPSVLLVDEATSHLDVMTERLVDQSLSALACTRIVIAHRLSTVKNADLILVLDEGEIVERGSHEELLDKRGSYTALIRGQAEIETTRSTLLEMASDTKQHILCAGGSGGYCQVNNSKMQSDGSRVILR